MIRKIFSKIVSSIAFNVGYVLMVAILTVILFSTDIKQHLRELNFFIELLIWFLYGLSVSIASDKLYVVCVKIFKLKK